MFLTFIINSIIIVSIRFGSSCIKGAVVWARQILENLNQLLNSIKHDYNYEQNTIISIYIDSK